MTGVSDLGYAQTRVIAPDVFVHVLQCKHQYQMLLYDQYDS